MFGGKLDSVQTIVFWEIQGSPIPENFIAGHLSLKIERALKKMGSSRVSLRAIGDDGNQLCDWEDFHLLYVPEEDEKEKRQKIIMTDVFGYAIRNRGKPINFVLIIGEVSEDSDIVHIIRLLNSKGFCKVFLAQEPKTSGQDGFEDWLKASLSAGNDLIVSDYENMGS